MSILLINGPNLNLLGQREPEIYGYQSLTDIEENLKQIAQLSQLQLISFQSNHEGEIIDTIQKNRLSTEFIIINPGAFTHTSVAIRDALLAVKIPFIELHISNVHGREDFRKKSYLSDIAVGIIAGLGVKGYELALQFAVDHILSKKT